jgi:phosphate transport system protein
MSIRCHFDKEMLFLHQEVLKMGVLVEQAIRKSLDALANKDVNKAQQVIDDDKIIDRFEKNIEDQCIQLIAREQPIATDLRTVITTLRIVSHLERIGDYGVHLAKSVLVIAKTSGEIPLKGIPAMAEMALRLIPAALTAFVNKDTEAAVCLAREDDKIDAMYKEKLRELLGFMKDNPSSIEQSVNLLFMNRFIERFADHVVDICEWVVYNVTGEHPDL